MAATLVRPALAVRPMATTPEPPPATPAVSDGDLIRRVAQGDRTALEELHARFARPIYGLALRRIRDRGRAEDATQDAFAALWRGASRYDPARGPGAAWLFTVARNAVTDVLRKTPEAAVADPPEVADGAPGPDQLVASDWEAWSVQRAVAALPASERELIELAYWSGMSQSEIADYLGVPLGTVKTRTRSALARLAAALEEDLA